MIRTRREEERAEEERRRQIVRAAMKAQDEREHTKEVITEEAYMRAWNRRRRNPLGRRKYWARSSAGVYLNNKFIYRTEQ